MRRAAAAAQNGVAALANPKLDIVFLTHLHSDHTLGLPDLLFSPWVEGRTSPLGVFGPPGATKMLEHLERAYAGDVDIRLHGGEPSNKTGWRFTAVDARPGVVYRDSNVTVTAGSATRPPERNAYHSVYHTSSAQLAMATRARPKLLVLDHQLFWGTRDTDLLKEVQSGYSGRVVSARDLEIYCSGDAWNQTEIDA